MNKAAKVAIFLTLMVLATICLALSIGGIKSGSITVTSAGPYGFGGIIPEANGSITRTFKLLDVYRAAKEIDKPIKLEDVSNRRLKTEVRLKVEQGNVRLELLDDREQSTASVVSTPGKTASVEDYWIADASGAVKYRITGTEAKNIRYSFRVDIFKPDYPAEQALQRSSTDLLPGWIRLGLAVISVGLIGFAIYLIRLSNQPI